MRKANVFLLYIVSLSLILGAVFSRNSIDRNGPDPARQARRDLVQRHGLTDLCLFTEARYTRHPSQADFHAPFQDSPLALEYFPSGSLMPPPPALKKNHGRPD
jgi:hypothetical protein